MYCLSSFRAGHTVAAVPFGAGFGAIALLCLVLAGVVSVSCAGSADEGDGGPAAPGLYAGDAAEPVKGIATLEEALTWLDSNAANDSRYSLYLNADENSVPRILEPATLHQATGVEIMLAGFGKQRVVTLTTDGNLFIVQGDNTKLILGRDITLHGKSDNNASVVQVNTGGLFEMQPGSKVINNTAHDGSTIGRGGGIFVGINGTLSISGGIISGNKALGTEDDGGGGILINAGTIQFSGGTLANNTTMTAKTGAVGSDNLRVFSEGNFQNTSGESISGSVLSN
jgi:hypothetical protein